MYCVTVPVTSSAYPAPKKWMTFFSGAKENADWLAPITECVWLIVRVVNSCEVFEQMWILWYCVWYCVLCVYWYGTVNIMVRILWYCNMVLWYKAIIAFLTQDRHILSNQDDEVAVAWFLGIDFIWQRSIYFIAPSTCIRSTMLMQFVVAVTGCCNECMICHW